MPNVGFADSSLKRSRECRFYLRLPAGIRVRTWELRQGLREEEVASRQYAWVGARPL